VRAAALLAALLAAGPAAAQEAPAECPSGTHRVLTNNPYDPFHCVKDGAESAKSALSRVDGPKGFEFRPRCPRGYRPQATKNSLQPYRCVRSGGQDSSPELTPMGDPGAPPPAEDSPASGCPRGKVPVRTNDPLNPYHCVAQAERLTVEDSGSFERYARARRISFEYPRSFRVQDAWDEDVPTLYLSLDDGRPGKPVTITVSLLKQSQASYQDIDAAMGKDFDWQGAKDGGLIPVAGRRARVTYVPGDTRSVYLPMSKESYYSFVYSAPADSYERYLPAFEHLLKTLRLGAHVR
jgi:hypothetical protein